MAHAGREALSVRPEASEPRIQEAWRLRLEGIAREIDAGFTADTLPADLAEVRSRIVTILQPA